MFMNTSGKQEADLITKRNLPFVDKNSLQNGLLYELYNFAQTKTVLCQCKKLHLTYLQFQIYL